jgi:hypothetical protein
MNRLQEFFEQPPEPERQDDFFEIRLPRVQLRSTIGGKADRRPWENDD